MRGLALAARRFVRVNHQQDLVAVSEWQIWRTTFGAVGQLHARRLTTDSLRCASPSVLRAEKAEKAEEAAYARIATKMATKPVFQTMDDATKKDKIETTVQFLEQRLQMDRTTAIRTVALHPHLTSSLHDALERKLDWLSKHGASDDDLHAIVRRHPNILQRSEESLERTIQWFLDLGIASSRIPYILRTAPEVASLAHATMNHKVDFLRDVGLNSDQIGCALQKSPRILLATVENMASKVEFATRLGVTRVDLVRISTLAPQFLSLSMDDVQRKLQVLDDLFGDQEGVRVWMTNPRVILSNPEQLRRTFEYLTHVVGMSRDRISQNVGLLMYSVDRVRLRYEFLTIIQSCDLGGVTWILMGETNFVKRHADYADFRARDIKQ